MGYALLLGVTDRVGPTKACRRALLHSSTLFHNTCQQEPSALTKLFEASTITIMISHESLMIVGHKQSIVGCVKNFSEGEVVTLVFFTAVK